MASVNKVILVGFLGQDPEIRTFPSGDQVANVNIATTDKWTDRQSGERREATEWHRLVFNGKLADVVGQYLRKGSQVYVEGAIRHRKYQDNQGVDRTITEIRVDHMQMLDRANGGGQGGGRDDGGYDDRQQGGGYGGGQGGGRGNYQQNNQGGGRGGYNNQGGGNRGGQGGRGGYGGQGGGGGYPNNGTRGAPPQGNQRSAPQQNDQRNAAPAQQPRGGGGGSTGFDDMDDDIPFVTSAFEADTQDRKSQRLGRASFR